MAVKVGVILSGCGFMDGSEVNEAVLALLHLAKAGAEVTCIAPDIEHSDVVNHLTGEPYKHEHMGVLAMSARIARGKVKNIADVNAADFDALVVPGGFGTAKNLSNYAFAKNTGEMVVEIHTQSLIADMFAARKPMGFVCISPAAVAAIALKNKGITVTCGSDAKAALTCLRSGNEHVDDVPANEVVVDKAHKIVSTPAYMASENLAEIDTGIAKLVKEVLALAVAK